MANDRERMLRNDARVAFERALKATLAGLHVELGHWRAGRLSGSELDERIQRSQHGVRPMRSARTTKS